MSQKASMNEAISVSIVSHMHGSLLAPLLDELSRFPEVSKIILTINVPEELPDFSEGFAGKLLVLNNTEPKGFGANHNAAFSFATAEYFCVLNPDVRLPENPFQKLIAILDDTNIAVVAPIVTDQNGVVEDNARMFPTPIRLLKKLIVGEKGIYPYARNQAKFTPDWVAGMFMLFPEKKYQNLQGFDERYFLYYEDVDICTRIWKSGEKVAVATSVSIIHAAQRASHKRLKFMLWHLASMIRFFATHLLSLPRSIRNSNDH